VSVCLGLGSVSKREGEVELDKCVCLGIRLYLLGLGVKFYPQTQSERMLILALTPALSRGCNQVQYDYEK
jgi:hypothetical protein